MRVYGIAVIAGDGVGPEVIKEGVRVLEASARDFQLEFEEFPWGCEYYARSGEMMPADGLLRLEAFDAIY